MTNKFVWDEKYTVGIPSLDAQHKDFFNTANHIVDLASNPETDRDTLLSAVKELEQHGAEHLATEEKYFDEFLYPEAASHKREHQVYVEKIDNFIKELSNPDADTKLWAEEIASYAMYWLSNHILIVDKNYTPFMKEHGVN